MFGAAERSLPFPRGDTYNEGSFLTLDDSVLKSMEGRIFWAQDTVHDTGQQVGLICVKNDTAAAITVARKFALFSVATAYDFLRRIGTFPNTTDGALVVAMDDAYTVGATIPDDDLFWCVCFGPVSILTGASVASFAAGMPVASDNAGLIADGPAAAGKTAVGRLIYAASYSTTTATPIFMTTNLTGAEAAG